MSKLQSEMNTFVSLRHVMELEGVPLPGGVRGSPRHLLLSWLRRAGGWTSCLEERLKNCSIDWHLHQRNVFVLIFDGRVTMLAFKAHIAKVITQSDNSGSRLVLRHCSQLTSFPAVDRDSHEFRDIQRATAHFYLEAKQPATGARKMESGVPSGGSLSSGFTFETTALQMLNYFRGMQDGELAGLTPGNGNRNNADFAIENPGSAPASSASLVVSNRGAGQHEDVVLLNSGHMLPTDHSLARTETAAPPKLPHNLHSISNIISDQSEAVEDEEKSADVCGTQENFTTDDMFSFQNLKHYGEKDCKRGKDDYIDIEDLGGCRCAMKRCRGNEVFVAIYKHYDEENRKKIPHA